MTARRGIARSRRVLAAVVAASCLVLGIAASPALAASPKPSDTSPLSALTFTSVSNGFSLDDQNGCNGQTNQQWTIPSAAYQSAWNMALGHAADTCTSNTSTCTWNATSQSAAAPLPDQCVSPIWYNDTSAPISWAFTITNTSGWSDALAIGGSLAVSGTGTVSGLPAPSPLQAKVGGTITGTGTVTNTFTYNVSQTLGNTVTIPVPAGDYGWIELAELADQVTGTWTFDVGGFPWTANDTVTVPLVTDSTGRPAPSTSSGTPGSRNASGAPRPRSAPARHRTAARRTARHPRNVVPAGRFRGFRGQAVAKS